MLVMLNDLLFAVDDGPVNTTFEGYLFCRAIFFNGRTLNNMADIMDVHVHRITARLEVRSP